MRVVASCGGKGGVGKTTAAVNVAALAARSLRVVLWDLDPQGAATHCLASVPAARGVAKAVVRGRHSPTEHAIETQFGVALIAADRSARNLDRLLDDEHRLQSLLEPLREHFDLVVLDCPPGAGRLAEHVVVAADGLLVPLIPGPLSLRALDQLDDLVNRVDLEGSRNGRRRPTLLPFFSMVDRRKRLHRDTVAALQLARPETLSAQIPMSAEIERMPVYRAPMVCRAPDGVAALAYAQLWREVQLRLAWAEPRSNRS